jgi:Fic family protein
MDSILPIIAEYRSLNLHGIIDYDKFNEFAIVHHSSAIEGSTLTENETRLLLDEGVTPKGKPLEHSLMVKDHYAALQFVLSQAKQHQSITPAFIQQINARVMKSTGAVYNTALGEIDATKGEFRKGNVSAGGSYFVGYDKVVAYTTKLATSLNEKIKTTSTENEKIEISFAAHFDLVSIHPFYDGNGRTSRLLMNYIQALFNLPLAIVFKEDKNEYFTALQESRKQESLQPFYTFMYGQYEKYLATEISIYKQSLQKKDTPKKSTGFSIFF